MGKTATGVYCSLSFFIFPIIFFLCLNFWNASGETQYQINLLILSSHIAYFFLWCQISPCPCIHTPILYLLLSSSWFSCLCLTGSYCHITNSKYTCQLCYETVILQFLIFLSNYFLQKLKKDKLCHDLCFEQLYNQDVFTS